MTREIIPATEEEVKLINDKIVAFNNSKVPFTQDQEPIIQNYVIKDASKVIAGINAMIYYWGILYVDMLFVDEEYRGQDLGSQLLNKVESEAKAIGATLVHLDTFDFQAKDFYLKAGYEIFGVLDDCPKGHQRYYLSKKL